MLRNRLKKKDVEWVEVLMIGLPKADAQARVMAVQIWAKMPGIICHPEYYKLNDRQVPI